MAEAKRTNEENPSEINELFTRAPYLEPYFYIDEFCVADYFHDARNRYDDRLYEGENYCRDGRLMKSRAAEERLSRKLWRFSMERNGSKVNKVSSSQKKYYIRYYQNGDGIVKTFISSTYEVVPGVIYFYERKFAEDAALKFADAFQEVYGKSHETLD